MEILPRSAWGALPAKGCTSQDPANLDGVVVHWFGSPRAAATHAGCDDLLRGVQKTHMAPGGLGTPNGALDIAYSHAVCPHGSIYELRGFNCRTGANGNADVNARYGAVVYMAGTGDPLTPVGEEAMGWIVRKWVRKTKGEVRTHGSITGSECPGPILTLWVKEKGWQRDPWKLVKDGTVFATGTFGEMRRWLKDHAAKVKKLKGINIRPNR